MDDVFDEDADELSVNRNEVNRIMENIEKEGFVEGIVAGKQKVVQDGFDKGYEAAFKYFYKINLLKGVVGASMNVQKNEFEQLKTINESLNNLEKQIMDDLIKDNKQDYAPVLNSGLDEIKKQMKELNLFKDLDVFIENTEEESKL